MALFGFGKEKISEGSADVVLAYFEDAQRVRIPFLLSGERGRETTAQLIGMSPKTGLATFQVQGPLPGEKGSRIQAIFILDGLRIGGTCQVVTTRTGQADLSLPSELEILERRKKLRAKLNPREGATLTALTGLFEGTGLTGVIENLSEIGARVKIERALEVKGEKKLSLQTSLVKPGHAFGLLRLSKLPRMSGAWECSGHSVYLEGGSAALYLGVSFSGFPSEALGALRSLISSRVNSLPSSLPPKSRRNQEPDPAPAAPPAPKVQESAAVQAPKVAEVVPPPVSVEAVPPSSGPASPTLDPVAPPRNTALLRLKKRSRSVVVIVTPGNAHRHLLVDFLNEEGYGKVLVAQTLQELLALLDEAKPSLLLVEDGVAELQGIDLMELLHQVHEDLPPLVLALEEISTTTVLAARRVGVSNLMVKPYELDDAFSAILENALGL